MASDALFRRAYPAASRLSIWQAPDGWRLRRFDWPADGERPRGSILFQAGRGDSVEKYLELLSHWHARGWSLTSLDWRGQGGSGRLADARVGHVEDFAHYVADFAAFCGEWAQAAPRPQVLIGHSMGGHLVLRALAEGRAEADAAVLVAPMLGLHSPLGSRMGEAVAGWMARRGDPMRAAWKANEIPGTRTPRQALLTHDDDRYADELWWHATAPELRLGPPSWRWVEQAFASTRMLRRPDVLATVWVPVQMLVADADRLVSAHAARTVAARLPDCALVRFGPESAHEILREADPVRDRAIAAIDAFLDARAPA